MTETAWAIFGQIVEAAWARNEAKLMLLTLRLVAELRKK